MPVLALALFGVALAGVATAQTPGQALSNAARRETVTWTVSAKSAEAVKPGARLVLTLQGAVQDGWHVYGFEQLPNGPTPLKLSLDASEVATADGAPAGSPAIKTHDPSFDLDTQYYAKPFTLTLPVRVGAKLPAGAQQIPVSVRFQTCNGQICQPPKTVRLSLPITVKAKG